MSIFPCYNKALLLLQAVKGRIRYPERTKARNTGSAAYLVIPREWRQVSKGIPLS